MSRKKWLLLLVLTPLALGGVVLLYLARIGFFDPRTLPSLGEIDAIQAMYYDDDDRRVFFTVSPEMWPEFLDDLTPATKDDHPMKWSAIGTLVVTKNSGRQILVELFSLHEPPGAFCIETVTGRTYYRGGDSAKLADALRTAYEASRKR
jgi:hypothetical protein